MPPQGTGREYYVDRLRTAMTIIVVAAHAMMTYGGFGTWFYREIQPSGSPTSIFFTLFNLTNQTWVMGLFFLLAGYFTPASLDKKGSRQFLIERALRLGLPLLIFGTLLAPLTIAMVSYSEGRGFWPPVFALWTQHRFVNGPMWFAQALLLFSIAYCLWRSIAGRRATTTATTTASSKFPSQFSWLISACAVALASVLLRHFFPVDTQQFGMWLSYFAGYIFFFALGITARRNNWLSQLTWKQARPWLLISILAWPFMPLAAAYTRKHHIYANFNGGFSWPAVLYAFWEPFLAWGIMAAVLLIFRQYANRPSSFGDWLGRRAYTVYVIHPPVMVAISLLLKNWHTPAMIKCGTVATLACTAAWVIADPLVRMIGVRRIF